MNNVSVTISLLTQLWSETGKVCRLTKEINEVELSTPGSYINTNQTTYQCDFIEFILDMFLYSEESKGIMLQQIV